MISNQIFLEHPIPGELLQSDYCKGHLLIFKEQVVALKGHDELRLVPAVSLPF